MCGSENPAGAQHCTVCGYGLQMESNAGGHKCARCGSNVPDGFDFCPVCGLDQRHRFARPATKIVRIDPDNPPVAPDALAENPAAGHGHAAPAGQGTPAQPTPQPGMRAYATPAPGQPQPMRPTPTPLPGTHQPVPAHPTPAPGSMQTPAPAGSPPQPGAEQGRPPAKTGRTVFMDGPPLPRPPELGPPSPPNPTPAPPAAPPVITPVRAVDPDDALTIPAPGKARLDSGIPVGGGFAPAVEPEPHPASGNTARSEGGAQQPAMLPPDMDDVETRAASVTGPRLVLVGRDGEEGQAFEFSGTTLTIGRQHGEIAFADDPFMSPQHARVERSGEMFTLVDLGSTNGVYLRTRGNASVYPGDLFMVGHQVLRLENVTDPVAEQHPAPDGTRLFGTPLKPAWGKLALIGRGGITGDTFYLRGAKVIFGREQGDILFPRDPFVSREHAHLRLELHGAQMSVFLEDQGSANGTYIRIRGSAEVRAGDTFRVGDQILRLRLDD
ncbi:MAG: FHA domain-containing protein [Nannocystaceae bacterium]|nr:FHA domain-containing protein [bacterium]